MRLVGGGGEGEMQENWHVWINIKTVRTSRYPHSLVIFVLHMHLLLLVPIP